MHAPVGISYAVGGGDQSSSIIREDGTCELPVKLYRTMRFPILTIIN
jgi:hypothetical protein